ncbi:MAG: helix-turn-helix domain-containing protein [Candidatus Dormibacteraceae bacterium]
MSSAGEPPVEDPVRRADEWIGLGEAARLLGVTPNTLRRWSDGGHVRSFTTPGGHRRFNRAAIEALVPQPRHRRPQLADLGASGAEIAAAYHRAAGGPEAPPWLEGISDADRERFRTRGRSMVECLVAYLDADRPAPALANLRQARDHANDYGEHIAGLGAGLTDAVEAYVRFRQPFLAELLGSARSRNLDASGVVDLLLDAESAMDQLLVAFVEGWERAGT